MAATATRPTAAALNPWKWQMSGWIAHEIPQLQAGNHITWCQHSVEISRGTYLYTFKSCPLAKRSILWGSKKTSNLPLSRPDKPLTCFFIPCSRAHHFQNADFRATSTHLGNILTLESILSSRMLRYARLIERFESPFHNPM